MSYEEELLRDFKAKLKEDIVDKIASLGSLFAPEVKTPNAIENAVIEVLSELCENGRSNIDSRSQAYSEINNILNDIREIVYGDKS